MGSESITFKEEVEIEILLRFIKGEETGAFELGWIETAEASGGIDAGEIEPGWMNEPPEDC